MLGDEGCESVGEEVCGVETCEKSAEESSGKGGCVVGCAELRVGVAADKHDGWRNIVGIKTWEQLVDGS